MEQLFLLGVVVFSVWAFFTKRNSWLLRITLVFLILILIEMLVRTP